MLLAAAILTAGIFSSAAPELPPATAAEVEGLLAQLGNSDCRFYRNGTWYGAADAQAHLRNKYEYLAKRHLIRNTEDFIAGVGEKSSMSGQPYQVQCAGQQPGASGPWLRERLAEMRRSAPERKRCPRLVAEDSRQPERQARKVGDDEERHAHRAIERP